VDWFGLWVEESYKLFALLALCSSDLANSWQKVLQSSQLKQKTRPTYFPLNIGIVKTLTLHSNFNMQHNENFKTCANNSDLSR